MQFGETVKGYEIPVLNEREIRASAGIMFLALFISFMMIQLKHDFLMVKYVIVVFLTDFIIRIFISPKFSPTLIIGRLIVSRQAPEYVDARQKNFAWKIGLALSGLMFVLLDLLNSYSFVTGVGCLLCLLFLFFESAFGICLGCWFYGIFFKDEAIYCAGQSCKTKLKDPIQKTSGIQLLIVLISVLYVLLIISLFNHRLQTAPANLKDVINYWFSSSSSSKKFDL